MSWFPAIQKTGDTWDVSFYYKDKLLTGGGWRSTSIIQESRFTANARMALQEDDEFFNYPQDAHTTYLREQLTTDIGGVFTALARSLPHL